MRTKTLLITAAAIAAGIATSVAQSTFSVNTVGYVNVEAKPGFNMIANPLIAEDNRLSALLPDVPQGTTVYKFVDGQFQNSVFVFGNWSADLTLVPGEGAFILNPGSTDLTLTFVGEVSEGSLSHAVPSGFSIQSSEVPQAGQLDTDLEFPVANGDTVYRFDREAQQYVSAVFVFGGWSPAANTPVLDVGESAFVLKSAATTWDRDFSVSDQ